MSPTQTTNTEGTSKSSFRVPYRIRGLWQYLEVIMAQKDHKGSFPQNRTIKRMVNGGEMFF
jgi:hypothetical protein